MKAKDNSGHFSIGEMIHSYMVNAGVAFAHDDDWLALSSSKSADLRLLFLNGYSLLRPHNISSALLLPKFLHALNVIFAL